MATSVGFPIYRGSSSTSAAPAERPIYAIPPRTFKKPSSTNHENTRMVLPLLNKVLEFLHPDCDGLELSRFPVVCQAWYNGAVKNLHYQFNHALGKMIRQTQDAFRSLPAHARNTIRPWGLLGFLNSIRTPSSPSVDGIVDSIVPLEVRRQLRKASWETRDSTNKLRARISNLYAPRTPLLLIENQKNLTPTVEERIRVDRLRIEGLRAGNPLLPLPRKNALDAPASRTPTFMDRVNRELRVRLIHSAYGESIPDVYLRQAKFPTPNFSERVWSFAEQTSEFVWNHKEAIIATIIGNFLWGHTGAAAGGFCYLAKKAYKHYYPPLNLPPYYPPLNLPPYHGG